jgi:hypothetical protein
MRQESPRLKNSLPTTANRTSPKNSRSARLNCLRNLLKTAGSQGEVLV